MSRRHSPVSNGGQPLASYAEVNRKACDVGSAIGDWGEKLFLESAGLGMFAHLITAMESNKKKKERPSASSEEEMRHALGTLREMLLAYKLHDCRITLDGHDYSGRYLSVEAMNIRSIGPNVELAPEAEPGDGLFDVVFISEDDREMLAAYLQHRLDGRTAELTLHMCRARRIRIASADKLKIHLDDEIVSIDSSTSLNVGLRPGALEFFERRLDEAPGT